MKKYLLFFWILFPLHPLVLYDVLPINRYIGNITIKHHNESMSDNRDPTVVLHQEIYTLPVSVASGTRCLQIFPILMNMLECY